MRSQRKQKDSRKVNPSAVRTAMLRVVDKRLSARGDLDFPCIPSLLDEYMARLNALWSSLARPFSEKDSDALRQMLDRALTAGYEASPFARVIVSYQAKAQGGLEYSISVHQATMVDHYANWLATRPRPLFGKLPDAKLMDVAGTLGARGDAPVLDVGAGTGRNALPLARLGHPVDAVELTKQFADELRKSAEDEHLSLVTIEGDILDAELCLEPARYALVVLSEVVTHFQDVGDVRRSFDKFAGAVWPGGSVLINAFLTSGGYKPDRTIRQVAETAWSSLFSREDLRFITDELPFELVSDESVYEYEKARLPAEGWPPTPWFESWTKGRNIVDLPADASPIELRWLLYRRR